MANSKKIVNFIGEETVRVNVPTSVNNVLIRSIGEDVFDGIETVTIDTYANDISGASGWGQQNVVWLKEPTCQISFDANGGTGTMEPRLANIGMAFNLPDCKFTRNKYFFNGWSINGQIYQPGSQYAFSGSTTIWASWTEMPNYLCFTANTAGSTIGMTVVGTPTLGQNFQTSTDGINWAEFIPGTTVITLANSGDSVYFKGNNPNGVSENRTSHYSYIMTGSISASGNIMSLIDNGACTTLTVPDASFICLFEFCKSLTTAPELPATTLGSGCYAFMFQECTSLTSAPVLPATTLKSSCYSFMFASCESFTTAPALPATILSEYCYCGMFAGCTALTVAPALPATALYEWCYGNMFQECTALTTAPALPATNLPSCCYMEMFIGCSSLVISETSGSGYSNAYKIPTAGTFTGGWGQGNMFKYCSGTRSSDSLNLTVGESCTYYTQNAPV